MKRLFGIAILIILAMTVHAGGGSEPQTGSANAGGSNTTTAAQLAAALNAMNEGSARVSGNTVTLTKSTSVQRNLTVPAGVTLELTGDGALWLGDNITLTVNGILNAPDNSIGTVGEARSMTINGNGTINLIGKGRLLITNGKKITLDGVTLVGVPDNDSALVIVNGGELVMVSGAIRGNGGGGVDVGNGGIFTMSGGAISGNTTARQGGGVFIGRGSTFTMSGGAISGNTSSGWGGGGVQIERDSTFTMSGGAISDNIVTSDGWACGGGVDVGGGATFTMKGGVISGNSANGVSGSIGGGVCVLAGTASARTTFTMEGGEIYGNTTSGGSSENGGGGVYVEEKNGVPSTFTMKGGVIYGSVGNLPAGTSASHANSARNGSSLYVQGRSVAQYGRQAPFTALGSVLTEAVNDILIRDPGEVWTRTGGRGTGRTISVNLETGVLTVTPAR